VDTQFINSLYASHPKVNALVSKLKAKTDKPKHLGVKGLAGSTGSLMAAACFTELTALTIIVLGEKEEAAFFCNDLAGLLSDHCSAGSGFALI